MQNNLTNNSLQPGKAMGNDFKIYITQHISHVEIFLKNLLQTTLELETTLPLHEVYEALNYSLFNGGKRLRPLLVYAIGEALDAPLERLHAPAAAVELIHCFSLVHDDLPAMDNDDFRRGKPTCHKAFNEATAILVGDALQSLAFELLSDPTLNPASPEKQIKMIQVLSKATGIHGMVGGQALDIGYAGNNSIELLQILHQKKTGALITASILLGFYASDKSHVINPNHENDPNHESGTDTDIHHRNSKNDRNGKGDMKDETLFSGLKQFGDLIGVAYQVQDDILDVEGSFEILGKTPGKDAKNEKLTFPQVMGLEQSKKFKQELTKKALESLRSLKLPATAELRLEQIAYYFIDRIQ